MKVQIALPLRADQDTIESVDHRLKILAHQHKRAMDQYAFYRAYVFKVWHRNSTQSTGELMKICVILQRERMMETAMAKREIELATAAERRKWEVHPITSTGKPDVDKAKLLNAIRQGNYSGDIGPEGVPSRFLSLTAVDVMMMFRTLPQDAEETYSLRHDHAVQQLEEKMRQTILRLSKLPSKYITNGDENNGQPGSGTRVTMPRNSDAYAWAQTTLAYDGEGKEEQQAPSTSVGETMKGIVDFKALREDTSDMEEEKAGRLPLPSRYKRNLKTTGKRNSLSVMAQHGARWFGTTANAKGDDDDAIGIATDEILSAHAYAQAAVNADAVLSAAAEARASSALADKLESAAAEQEYDAEESPPISPAPDNKRKQTRAEVLVDKVAALNAQAEIQQYGVLLKPLMEGMTRMMMHTMAADATAGAIKIASDTAEIRNHVIDERVRDLHATRATREASRVATALTIQRMEEEEGVDDSDTIRSQPAESVGASTSMPDPYMSAANEIDSWIAGISSPSKTSPPKSQQQQRAAAESQQAARTKFWHLHRTRTRESTRGDMKSQGSTNLGVSRKLTPLIKSGTSRLTSPMRTNTLK